MKIQYASDLHLEFDENQEFLKANPLEVAEEILVLAGDVAYFGEQIHRADWFFDWCAGNFRETYIVPGNHEYFDGYPVEDTIDDFEAKIRPNVTYYNNKSVRLGDIELFFSTLWSPIPPEEALWYQQTDNGHLCAADRNRFHRSCLEWLERSISASAGRKKVVVTHHCPYLSTAGNRYVGGRNRHAYMCDLRPLISRSGASHWIHGHIHTPLAACYNTLVVSNPLGYVEDGEHLGFKTQIINL